MVELLHPGLAEPLILTAERLRLGLVAKSTLLVARAVEPMPVARLASQVELVEHQAQAEQLI